LNDSLTSSSDPPFWSKTAEQLFSELQSSEKGLSPETAKQRLASVGGNVIKDDSGPGAIALLAKQFSSPLVLILLFGAAISFWLRDVSDAVIIIVIVCTSALLSFWQEARASNAVAALRSRLALTSRVVRSGVEASVPAADLVPGDVIILSAGNLVPADGLILEATDFLVTEAALTGESLPVEKKPGQVPAQATISACTNCVFTGSSVRSGTARVLVVHTARNTEFGKIADRLQQSEPETDFDRGVRHFGSMLLKVMFLIVTFVLAINQLLGRPFVESLLFAVALAVGLSPELLPAIVTVTLSTGARHLAQRGVIVRRLEAMENFGSMTVLCTDKTGTITTGDVVLTDATDPDGHASPAVKRLAFLNASLETGIANPLDAALVAAGTAAKLNATGVTKVDEIPYDFQRRRLTIVLDEAGKRLLVTKGAFAEVLAICSSAASSSGATKLTAAKRSALERYFSDKGADGFRVLALATKEPGNKADYTFADECDLTFQGFLMFLDPPKETAAAALRELKAAGIATKIISGDNRHVTAHVASIVGLNPHAMLTGEQLGSMTDEALWHDARRTDLFVEIEPQQKERIVRALQKTGYAVGYLGDGINDAPALRAADIGISVDGAVDVARESADIILLKSDLGVLGQGVEDGRKTFANTLKYINITISANFGNMISMALATLLLPFLPLLPKQILLNNFLSDLPALAISTDAVDPEYERKPQRWDIHYVERFMVLFGLASSLFDFVTFGALLYLFHAGEAQFQTGWFTVSLMTELLVVMVLRTRRLPWQSRPGTLLLATTIIMFIVALVLPYTGPVARLFGLVPLGMTEFGALLAIVAAYVAATELLKHWFYRRVSRKRHLPPLSLR
jgi:Mg2+-importing ATPase